jgi:hypothetical protein
METKYPLQEERRASIGVATTWYKTNRSVSSVGLKKITSRWEKRQIVTIGKYIID